MRAPRMNDSPRPRSLLVRLAHHARVRDDRHVGQVVRGHERLDDRQHGLGLGLVALEGADHEREPVAASEQADGDLRLQPPFLGEPALAEPVTLIGLEIQSGDVVEDQAGRAQPGMRGTRSGDLLPPRVLRIGRQPPLERGIRRRRNPGLLQHPQRVQLADRLDDPRQHQLAEHLVPARRPPEPQHVIAAAQPVEQAPHPRGRDRQRPARAAAETRAQIKLALPGRQPLPRDGLEQLQLCIIVRGPDVLDLPRPAMVGVHDLHRHSTRRRLHRPHIRHLATLRPPISAQIRTPEPANMQVTAACAPKLHDREPSQAASRASRVQPGMVRLIRHRRVH